MAINEQQLEAFLGKAVGDLGAAMSAMLVLIGDGLGLYKALATGPLTPAELPQKTGTFERYVRESLGNQAAGGCVDYDPPTGTVHRHRLSRPVDRYCAAARTRSRRRQCALRGRGRDEI